MIDSMTLKNHPMFGGLLEDQIEKVLLFMTEESYGPSAGIIFEGTPTDTIRFILEGKVSVLKGELLLSVLGEGDTFGEMEVLDVMPCAATVKAVTAVKVIALSNKSLHEIYKNDIAIFSMLVMNLARDLSRRLRKANEALAETKLSSLHC